MLLDLLMSLTGAMMFIESPREILYHNGFAQEDTRQAYVHYAFDLGGIEFVKMIECENGNRDPYKKSKTNDFGLCQLHYKYNKDFISSTDYHNPFKQLDYCYQKWKINPNLWSGPKRKINGNRCSDLVSTRFYSKII